jgi:hypothetical protein
MLPGALDRDGLPISLKKLADRIERAFFYALLCSTFQRANYRKKVRDELRWIPETRAMLQRTSQSPPCLAGPIATAGRTVP